MMLEKIYPGNFSMKFVIRRFTFFLQKTPIIVGAAVLVVLRAVISVGDNYALRTVISFPDY